MTETLSNNKQKTIFPSRMVWWSLLAIVVLAAIIRYNLLDVPLERDEGEYAYGAQLMLQGFLPYQELYSMKLPGIYAAYAGLLMIFGQTHWSIHFGLLFINAATIILIFLLARHLISQWAGIASAACFAVLSVSPSVQGIFANAEHFVILPVMAGLALLLKALDEDRPEMLFFSGVMLGTGFLIKQHGAAFLGFGGIYALIDQIRKHPGKIQVVVRCGVFAAGGILPYALTCLIFAYFGVFEKLWFWTVSYAMAYTSQVPLDYAWKGLKEQSGIIFRSAPLIWILVGIGVIALFWNKTVRQHFLFVGLFAIFSALAMCPGFYFFRPHYYIFILPASALFAGAAVHAIADELSRFHHRMIRYGIPIAIIVVCTGISVYQQRHFLFQMTPLEIIRSVYGDNPFSESLEIARFVQSNTQKSDRIAIIGSEPQIYFYSHRRGASGYIYMYPLMESHNFALQMQKEMIKEVEVVRPEMLIFVNVKTSWLAKPGSHPLLIAWFNKYKQHYMLAGRMEIFKDGSVWQQGEKLRLPPQSRSWIMVMKRKS